MKRLVSALALCALPLGLARAAVHEVSARPPALGLASMAPLRPADSEVLSQQAAELAQHAQPEPGAAAARTAPDESPALARALVSGAAGAEFIETVRRHVAATFPAPVLEDLLSAGYRIEANAHIRQGREHLHEDNDHTGGFHSHGPKGNFIIIAENIKMNATGEWRPSRVWENAVNHEMGHALGYVHGEREAARVEPQDPDQARWYRDKGLSEAPGFREQWRLDYEGIPAELKSAERPDGSRNPLFYFLHPDDDNGWFQRARQETFAEGFDILLRGARSAFNHANFTRYFPRSLAEIRREIEKRYGAVFPPAS